MKCANDILTIAERVAERRAKEEERRLMALSENTIEFCESTIAPMIEESAFDGRVETKVIVSIDHNCHYAFRKEELKSPYTAFTLVPTDKQYANGDKSFTRDKRIHLGMLEEYLKRFCYSIHIEFDNEAYQCYGNGRCSGYIITIIPNPQC